MPSQFPRWVLALCCRQAQPPSCSLPPVIPDHCSQDRLELPAAGSESMKPRDVGLEPNSSEDEQGLPGTWVDHTRVVEAAGPHVPPGRGWAHKQVLAFVEGEAEWPREQTKASRFICHPGACLVQAVVSQCQAHPAGQVLATSLGLRRELQLE